MQLAGKQEILSLSWGTKIIPMCTLNPCQCQVSQVMDNQHGDGEQPRAAFPPGSSVETGASHLFEI